jgi:hypothetical protein
MFNLQFWKAATERALKSGAQFVILTIGGGTVAGATGNETVNAFLLDYPTLGGVFLGGAILSYLTSVISAPFSGDGPSLANESLE